MSQSDSDEMLRKALANAKHLALESTSDEDAPLALHELSLLVQAKTGQRVTATKRHKGKRYEPEFPPSNLLAWYVRQMTGKTLPTDPKRVSQPYRGWGFVVAGNGVIVEGYLLRLGFKRAGNTSATFCYVCDDSEVEKIPKLMRKRRN